MLDNGGVLSKFKTTAVIYAPEICCFLMFPVLSSTSISIVLLFTSLPGAICYAYIRSSSLSSSSRKSIALRPKTCVLAGLSRLLWLLGLLFAGPLRTVIIMASCSPQIVQRMLCVLNCTLWWPLACLNNLKCTLNRLLRRVLSYSSSSPSSLSSAVAAKMTGGRHMRTSRIRGGVSVAIALMITLLFDCDQNASSDLTAPTQKRPVGTILSSLDHLLAHAWITDRHKFGIFCLLCAVSVTGMIIKQIDQDEDDSELGARLVSHVEYQVGFADMCTTVAVLVWELSRSIIRSDLSLGVGSTTSWSSMIICLTCGCMFIDSVPLLIIIKYAGRANRRLTVIRCLLGMLVAFGSNLILPDSHPMSLGLLVACLLFLLGNHWLTWTPRASGGFIIGYRENGNPMYELSHSVKRSGFGIATIVKNAAGFALKEIFKQSDSKRLFLFLCVNLMFTFVEMAYGIWTNSLGLLSDAFHMLFDCTALILGLYASLACRWNQDKYFNYGYSRVEVLSGFINGLFLSVVGLFVLLEACGRMFSPPEIKHDKLLIVSIGGLLVNLVGLMSFHHHHHHSGGSHHSCHHDHVDDHHHLHHGSCDHDSRQHPHVTGCHDHHNHDGDHCINHEFPHDHIQHVVHHNCAHNNHHLIQPNTHNDHHLIQPNTINGHHLIQLNTHNDHHLIQPNTHNDHHLIHPNTHNDHHLIQLNTHNDHHLIQLNTINDHHLIQPNTHNDHHLIQPNIPNDYHHLQPNTHNDHHHTQPNTHNDHHHTKSRTPSNLHFPLDLHFNHSNDDHHHHRETTTIEGKKWCKEAEETITNAYLPQVRTRNSHYHRNDEQEERNQTFKYMLQLGRRPSDLIASTDDYTSPLNEGSESFLDDDMGNHVCPMSSNANMRAVFLHVLADTLGSVGVIISSFLIQQFQWNIADPICSLFLALMILASVVPLLIEAAESMVLRVPRFLEKRYFACLNKIIRVPGVLACSRHCLWSLASDKLVCAVTIVCRDNLSVASRRRLKTSLRRFLISKLALDQLVIELIPESFVCENVLSVMAV